MNKIIALIIILTLSIGVVGCGSSDSKEKAVASKEELLVSATKLTADQLLNEIGGNKAKAKNYIGN